MWKCWRMTIIDRSVTFPTIIFSDRVHNQIDRNMRNYVIVHLLGRTTDFKVLLGQIHAIWKPLGEIQLIDLDNEYYLVRFTNKLDYAKFLIEGHWTIHESFLTV
ncbi:hypothetical protein GQ457_10G013930 [Hibiscus cannabinus]